MSHIMSLPLPKYRRPLWVSVALCLGAWTLVGLFDAWQAYLHSLFNNSAFVWWRALLLGVSDWYVMAALTPAIFFLARRFPFAPGHRVRDGAVHALASCVCSGLIVGVTVPFYAYVACPLGIPLDLATVFQKVFFGKFQMYVLLYWMLVGLSRGLDYYQKYRERELQASQLAARLAETQLQVLKMQLHPHFLFNTLHAISALIHKDVELADRMVARLGELLRSTLENAGTQEVSLRHELDFIKPYLEIEQARLGPRLSVHLDIDPETMDASVPNLLLQPLVENAIRHGVAPRTGPGRIEIAARRENGHLQLQVRDNGRGLATNYAEGVGVGNTRARLAQLYGANHVFAMRNRPDGGLEVTVSVPYRDQTGEDLVAGVEGSNQAISSPPRAVSSLREENGPAHRVS
jgi:two-component sensor histidine kinase